MQVSPEQSDEQKYLDQSFAVKLMEAQRRDDEKAKAQAQAKTPPPKLEDAKDYFLDERHKSPPLLGTKSQKNLHEAEDEEKQAGPSFLLRLAHWLNLR